jgi:flagellar P-ring protein FlgI
MTTRRIAFATALVCAVVAVSGRRAVAQSTVAALTTHEGNVPVRLIGFGLVVGLDGTGDRSLGGFGRSGGTSARAVANLLQRFGMAVSGDLMQVRNVAAVMVQADIDPYLRAGQRFELQVSSLHDATSLRGGQLLMMPLFRDLGDTLVLATGSGGLLVQVDPAVRLAGRGGASGRVIDGGLIEVDLPRPQVSAAPLLSVNRPGVSMATHIAAAINGALGDGVAVVEDPGSIRLNPPSQGADNLIEFLAGIDTLTVSSPSSPKIIVNRYDGTVATVGLIMIEQTTSVSHNGITLTIGQAAAGGPAVEGLVAVPLGVSVQDVAAGLHAAGARPQEVATIFELLRRAGALVADIEVQ